MPGPTSAIKSHWIFKPPDFWYFHTAGNTHVYIAMIHSFGDGNGRTVRLIEFYILLRAGLPDIASHILSNHYNDTRQEYYRQIDLCIRERDLSGFVRYVVQGFRDDTHAGPCGTGKA